MCICSLFREKITQKHIDTLLDKAHRQIICIIKVVQNFSYIKTFLFLCYTQSSTPLGIGRASRVALASSHDTNQSQMLNTHVPCSLLCSTQIDTGANTVLTKLIHIKHLTSGCQQTKGIVKSEIKLHQFLI